MANQPLSKLMPQEAIDLWYDSVTDMTQGALLRIDDRNHCELLEKAYRELRDKARELQSMMLPYIEDEANGI